MKIRPLMLVAAGVLLGAAFIERVSFEPAWLIGLTLTAAVIVFIAGIDSRADPATFRRTR